MTKTTSRLYAFGLHFAILQAAYFFMLEVFYSSRAASYFIALFFWLIGFLAGLNLQRRELLSRLIAAGTACYYVALAANQIFTFRMPALAATGCCVALSGVGPGYFFANAKVWSPIVRPVLFHENNGFIVGTMLGLFAMIFAGRWLLFGGPAATAVLLAVLP